MTDEYTPTTEEVREQFAVNIARFGPGFGSEEVGREGFDRWLAQHDREVAARALREAADYAESFVGEPAHHDRSPVLYEGVEEKAFTLESWLRDRANRVEKGENDD